MWKKLPKRRSYEKRMHIKLMKLTVAVNFTNILWVAFCQFPFAKKVQTETKSTDKLCKIVEKGARKMLFKLTPAVDSKIWILRKFRNFLIFFLSSKVLQFVGKRHHGRSQDDVDSGKDRLGPIQLIWNNSNLQNFKCNLLSTGANPMYKSKKQQRNFDI